VNPGLPPVPEPPHDPKSILLNARTGFRPMSPVPGQPAVVSDPRCGALVLPTSPAAQRHFTEPSGSLGGVRPPSNVAMAPDGSIRLLDRARLTLRTFDPCTCAFVDVPCFGGEGTGPRELRDPGGIAIGGTWLYVCDTGNERVSVCSLRGYALRGHLRPPRAERPWRPARYTGSMRTAVVIGRGRYRRLQTRSPPIATAGSTWSRCARVSVCWTKTASR
jgi:hypothetical protein